MSLLLLSTGLLLLFLLLVCNSPRNPKPVVLRVHILIKIPADKEVSFDGFEGIQNCRGDRRDAIEVQVLQGRASLYDVFDRVLCEELALANLEMFKNLGSLGQL